MEIDAGYEIAQKVIGDRNVLRKLRRMTNGDFSEREFLAYVDPSGPVYCGKESPKWVIKGKTPDPVKTTRHEKWEFYAPRAFRRATRLLMDYYRADESELEFKPGGVFALVSWRVDTISEDTRAVYREATKEEGQPIRDASELRCLMGVRDYLMLNSLNQEWKGVECIFVSGDIEPRGDVGSAAITVQKKRKIEPDWAIFGWEMDTMIKYMGRQKLPKNHLEEYNRLYAKKTGIVGLRDGSLII